MSALLHKPLAPEADVSFEQPVSTHKLNPHINVFDAVRLLKDYCSGLLAKHDQTLGEHKISHGGFVKASTLTGKVEHRQVTQVLDILERKIARPAPGLPPCEGWWVYVLYWHLKKENPEDHPHFPIPTMEDQACAWTIFCNLLYKVCFEKEKS